MRKLVVMLVLLGAVSMSMGANIYWKSTSAGSSDFTLVSNWSATYTTASDSMRVGSNSMTTYPYSRNLAKLTTGWGAADSTANDALYVGGYGYQGNFELDSGSNTAYFRSIIVGDTKAEDETLASVMTITSGTIRSNTNAAGSPDTGYFTIGRNNTAGSAYYGVGYLYINGGTVAMDRITVGELRAGNTYAGEGHIVLRNDGVIDLPCVRTFDPVSYVGLKINNGDLTWVDNGASIVRTGSLSLGKDGGAASLIFQSSDNVIGQDGKGIIVFDNDMGGDGMATFSASAVIDVTGLADSTSWVTLITAANGFTFADESILSDASVAEGWVYRTVNVADGVALQVCIPEPATIALLSFGVVVLFKRRK